jgi:rubrerythrin
MMQFKIDVDDRERRPRIELDEAARRFRSELGISLDKVKRFSTESFQQAAEREDRMRQAFDKILDDMQSELLKSAGQFGPALRDSVNSQTEQILEEVAKTIEQANKKTCDAIEDSMSEMTTVATKLSQTNIDAAKVVAKGVEELRATAEKVNDEAKVTLLKLSESVAQHSTFATDTTSMLEKQSKAINAVLSNSTSLLEAHATGLESSVESLKAAADRSQADLVAVHESQESIATTISNLNNVLAGTSDKLSATTTTKVSELEVSMAALSKAIEDAASAVAEAGAK